jgi:hypothetical protein
MPGLQGRQAVAIEAGDKLGHRIAAAAASEPGGLGKGLAGSHGQQGLGSGNWSCGLGLGPADAFQLPPLLGGEGTQRILLAA